MTGALLLATLTISMSAFADQSQSSSNLKHLKALNQIFWHNGIVQNVEMEQDAQNLKVSDEQVPFEFAKLPEELVRPLQNL